MGTSFWRPVTTFLPGPRFPRADVVLGQVGNERYHFKCGRVIRPEQSWTYVQPPFSFYLYCSLLFSAAKTERPLENTPLLKISLLSCLYSGTLRFLDLFTHFWKMPGDAACERGSTASDHQGPLFLTLRIPGIGCQLGTI